jgi:hypothetical protein
VAIVPTRASTGKITVTNTTAPVGTVASATSYDQACYADAETVPGGAHSANASTSRLR